MSSYTPGIFSSSILSTYKEGQLGVGVRMKATLSVDHRVSDGGKAAKFIQALVEALENPIRLLL